MAIDTQFPREAEYGHRGWIMVDREFAGHYMALVASILGQEGPLKRCPVTDQTSYLPLSTSRPTLRAFDGPRAALLRDVLPAPDHSVDPAEIVAFKDRHFDLLRGLRRHVESILLDCARERDDDLRGALVEAAADHLRERTAEVRQRMHEHRWITLQDGICALVMGTPAVAGGLATHKPGMAALGAAPLAVEVVKAFFSRTTLPDDPVVYAALALDHFT